MNKNSLFHEVVGLRDISINKGKITQIPVRPSLDGAILGLLRRLVTMSHYQCLIMTCSAYQFRDTVGRSVVVVGIL